MADADIVDEAFPAIISWPLRIVANNNDVVIHCDTTTNKCEIAQFSIDVKAQSFSGLWTFAVGLARLV